MTIEIDTAVAAIRKTAQETARWKHPNTGELNSLTAPMVLALIEEMQDEWRKGYEAATDRAAMNLAMQLCRQANYDPWEICGKAGTLAGCTIPSVAGEVAAAVSLQHSILQFKPLWVHYMADAERIIEAQKLTP